MKLDKILISKDFSVKRAADSINEGGVQLAIVVDSSGSLLGTITDGDIRRGIINGISIEDTVESVMNSSPICITTEEDTSRALKLMKEKGLLQIPVIDENRIVVDLVLHNALEGGQRDNWVVIMAGGLGQRLGDLTKDTPKPLLKVGSKPILENILESFIEHGFKKFYFTVNYKYEQIIEYFEDGARWDVQIEYLKEEKRLGTAGSLSLIKDKMDSPLIVMNGDLLTKVNFTNLLSFHKKTKSTATMCVREFDYQVPFGVVDCDGIQFNKIEEKPVHRYFVNAGVYVLDPSVLPLVPNNEYFDMPSLLSEIKNRKANCSVFPIHEYWLDIGQVNDYKRANSDIENSNV
jgi:dTDP-glucose pyrophosphorylase